MACLSYSDHGVSTLWDLEPDQPVWPASFHSKLALGAYTLTWSAHDYGGVVVDFTIVQLDGWLYLGEEWIWTTDGEFVPDERAHGAFRSLVSLAKVDLAQRLGIDPEAVSVEEINQAGRTEHCIYIRVRCGWTAYSHALSHALNARHDSMISCSQSSSCLRHLR